MSARLSKNAKRKMRRYRTDHVKHGDYANMDAAWQAIEPVRQYYSMHYRKRKSQGINR